MHCRTIPISDPSRAYPLDGNANYEEYHWLLSQFVLQVFWANGTISLRCFVGGCLHASYTHLVKRSVCGPLERPYQFFSLLFFFFIMPGHLGQAKRQSVCLIIIYYDKRYWATGLWPRCLEVLSFGAVLGDLSLVHCCQGRRGEEERNKERQAYR